MNVNLFQWKLHDYIQLNYTRFGIEIKTDKFVTHFENIKIIKHSSIKDSRLKTSSKGFPFICFLNERLSHVQYTTCRKSQCS